MTRQSGPQGATLEDSRSASEVDPEGSARAQRARAASLCRWTGVPVERRRESVPRRPFARRHMHGRLAESGIVAHDRRGRVRGWYRDLASRASPPADVRVLLDVLSAAAGAELADVHRTELALLELLERRGQAWSLTRLKAAIRRGVELGWWQIADRRLEGRPNAYPANVYRLVVPQALDAEWRSILQRAQARRTDQPTPRSRHRSKSTHSAPTLDLDAIAAELDAADPAPLKDWRSAIDESRSALARHGP